MSTPRNRIQLTEPPALLLSIVVTLVFALLLVLEWQLLDISLATVPYYFGFTFIIWALTLVIIGYWYQSRRQSDDQGISGSSEFAYIRDELTTEEHSERQQRLRKKEAS